jgi:hypothetical protein
MLGDFLTRYKVELEARIVQLTEKLQGGSIADFPQYKLIAGEIRGLKKALVLAKEVNEKLDVD